MQHHRGHRVNFMQAHGPSLVLDREELRPLYKLRSMYDSLIVGSIRTIIIIVVARH